MFSPIYLCGLPVDALMLCGFLALIVSALVAKVFVSRILAVSYRRRMFDFRDERKVHRDAIPRLGGLAFMPAIILTISVVVGLNVILFKGVFASGAGAYASVNVLEVSFGLGAMMVLYLTGLIDDLVGLNYKMKFAMQAVGSLLFVASGVVLDDLGGFLGVNSLSPVASAVLTFVVVMLIVNAINFIDGIDGLASGLSAMGFGYYAWVSYSNGAVASFVLSLTALGVLVPYVYFNVFGDETSGKKIFMGDTGSLTLGILLSYLSIKVSGMPANRSIGFDVPLAMAFSPLVVPCLDLLRVVIRRLRTGRNPFEPGRTHIHHKLLALGLGQRIASVVILAMSAGFMALNVGMVSYLPIVAVLAIDIVIWTTINLWLTRKIKARCRKNPSVAELFY